MWAVVWRAAEDQKIRFGDVHEWCWALNPADYACCVILHVPVLSEAKACERSALPWRIESGEGLLGSDLMSNLKERREELFFSMLDYNLRYIYQVLFTLFVKQETMRFKKKKKELIQNNYCNNNLLMFPLSLQRSLTSKATVVTTASLCSQSPQP